MLHVSRNGGARRRPGSRLSLRSKSFHARLAKLSLAVSAAVPTLLLATHASAANGVWTSNAAGTYSWSVTTNWSGGTVPSATDDLANFSTVDLLGDATVILDISPTVGNLTFGDTDTLTAGSWIIAAPGAMNLSVSSGAPTITVNALGTGKVVRFDAGVNSSAGLTKAGAGTLVLNGANAISGPVTISGGALQVGNGGTTGTMFASDIANSGQLVINRSDQVDYNNNLSGTGGLVKLGTGVLNLGGNNTYSGATAISRGLVNFTQAQAFTSLAANSITVNAGGAVGNGTGAISDATFLGKINAAGSTGALALTGGDAAQNFDFTSGTFAPFANMSVGAASGQTVTYTGTVTPSAATYRFGGGGGTVILSNPISGTNALVTGGGTGGAGGVVLSQNNGYTGTTTITAGVLQVGVGTTTGSLGTGDVVNNGELSIDRSDNITISNNITGTGIITKMLGSAANTVTLSGNNTAGALNVQTNAGTVTVTGGLVCSNLSTINNGGTFILSTGSAVFNGGIRTSNNDSARIIFSGGTFSASDFTVQRSQAGGAINFGNGFIINGGVGTVNTVNLGTNNSNGAMTVDSGSLFATGTITIGVQNTGGRGGAMRVAGGTFTSTESTFGVVLGRSTATNTNQASSATFTGGVSKVNKFTMGFDSTVTGSSTVGVAGGTLYIGAGGIVKNGTSTSVLSLGNGTLGALADWSSSPLVGIPLTTATTINIVAADDTGTAHNISLGGVISGSGNIVKHGAGMLTLTGTNTYTGSTTVNAGTLAGSTDSLKNNIANSGNVTFNQLSNGTYSAQISGSGSFSKNGSAQLVMANAQTYTGATFVNGGELRIGGTQGTSGVTINNGGALSLSSAATVGGLTMGTTGTDTSTLSVGSSSGPLMITAPNLAANGNAKIVVGATGLSAGTFPLIDYTGSIGGSGFGAFSLASLPPRISASLVNNVGATRVDLNVTQVDFPRWTGAVNSNWDINATTNWREFFSGTATNYLQNSVPGDVVLFDDTATGSTNVNITTTVQPTAVTANNSTKNYTFSGSGKISGTTALTKQGTGNLTISNTGGNDYTGGTNVTAGTMIVTQSNGLPSAGNVSVSGGTLLLQAGNSMPATGLNTLSGGTLDLGGQQHDITGGVTLIGGRIVNGTINKTGGNYDLQSGTVNGNLSGTAGINKTNAAGTVVLTGNQSLSGPIVVGGGTLQLGDGTTDGSIPVLSNVTNTGVFVMKNVNDVYWGQPNTANRILGTAGTVVKDGPGNWTLAGTGSEGQTGGNEGSAIINAGTVTLRGYDPTVATPGSYEARIGRGGSVTINSGATVFTVFNDGLGLNSATAPPSVTINAGGTLRLDDSTNSSIQLYGGTLNGGLITGGGSTSVTLRNALNAGTATNSTINVANLGAANNPNLNVFDNATLTIDSAVHGTANFTKAGNGTLILTSSASDYNSITTVNAGHLVVSNTSGSATGAGTVQVNANGTVRGNGIIGGTLSTAAGGTIAPGNSIGVLTAANVTLDTANLPFEVGAGTADLLVATNFMSAVNTSTFNISDAGGMTTGSYVLIDYPGSSVISLSNFTLAATTVGSFDLALVNDTGNSNIVLQVTPSATVNATWTGTNNGAWNDAGNWSGGIPNGSGHTANFASIVSGNFNVTVDAAGKTVGTVNFNNATSYTVAGPGTLTLDSGSTVGVNVLAGNHTISAPVSLAKNATFNVTPAGNSLTLSNLLASSVTITKDGAGTLALNNARAAGLTVNTGTVAITANGTSTGTSKLTSLTLAGGTTPSATLDLNDNDLVTGAAKATVEAQVKNARNNGNWNQTGITSTTARNNANHTTGLGVLSGAEYTSVGGAGNFSGQSYAAGDTLVKYTWNGDANFDGRITFDDYVKIDTGFNTHLTGWLNGDFNYSGAVNFDDYVLIDIAFNQQSGTLGRAMDWISGDDRSTAGLNGDAIGAMLGHLDQFGSAYGAAFLAAVPEPTTLGVVGIVAAAGLLNRRRRQR